MRLQTYLIGMLMIGACVLAIVGFAEKFESEQYSHYYGNLDLEEGEYDFKVYDKVEEISDDWNKTASSISKITGSNQDTEYEDYRVGLWQRTKDVIWGVGGATSGTVSGITGTLTLGINMIQDLGRGLIDLPRWVINIMSGALTIMLVLIMFKYAFGREP